MPTRQICDGNLKLPQNFCPKHCGKINDLCHNNKCFIIHTQNNKKLDLTCGKTDHSNRHFLICQIEGCRKASKKYWQNQEKKKVVINLLPADDLHDLNNERIDINFEDLDQKIDLSDHTFVHQLYVPTMAIKDDNEPITHSFLKTFFRLEKS